MAEKITFSWGWYKDLQPIEWLQEIGNSFLEIAEEWGECDSNYFEDYCEDCKAECPDISKKEMYSEMLHTVTEGQFHISYVDSMNVVQEINDLRENVLKAFDNSVIFPNILNAIGILEYVNCLVKSFTDNFWHYLYYCAFFSSEEVSEVYGKIAAKRFNKEVELTEDDYEKAFECFTEFLEIIENGQFSEKLRDCVWAIKGYCELKAGSKKYAETEAKRPITLIQFMRKHCEQQKIQLLRYRRKSLNDANFRKSIMLPEPIQKWKTGQAKYYNPSDLKEKWPTFCEILPNLPPLKQPN